MKRLREIAEAGIAAYDRMLEVGYGIGALSTKERGALRAYEDVFSARDGKAVLALLDVAEAAMDAVQVGRQIKYPQAGPLPGSLSPHFRVLGAEYRSLVASLDRLREVGG